MKDYQASQHCSNLKSEWPIKDHMQEEEIYSMTDQQRENNTRGNGNN